MKKIFNILFSILLSGWIIFMTLILVTDKHPILQIILFFIGFIICFGSLISYIIFKIKYPHFWKSQEDLNKLIDDHTTYMEYYKALTQKFLDKLENE